MESLAASVTIGDYNEDDLHELRLETVQRAIISLACVAIGILGGATFIHNQVNPESFAILAGLLAVALGARGMSVRSGDLAAGFLVLGMSVVFLIAMYQLPPELIAPWVALETLIASAILGWWRAAAVIVGQIAIIFGSVHSGGIDASPAVIEDAILLGGASLFVWWVISYPNRVALAWASSNYHHTLQLIQEARSRQAELARLSKSLSESYYVLEQLNLDLLRARRAAEEARQLKARFAAAVSHELRTPLNLIIGFCEMMVLSPSTAYGERLPSGYRDDLEAIYRNAGHISNLVDDILDLSQIDADRMALHREVLTLRSVIDEAVATVDTLFRNRALHLKISLDAALPPLDADRTRIRQILINVLANAARFTERGGVTIRAESRDDAIVIAMTDTGPGIPSEMLPYIFEEFHQGGDLSPRRSGSGFGLAVSRRFAELHGGQMWVESELGRGSTFYLLLPTHNAGNVVRGEGIDGDQRVTARVRGVADRSILVVDASHETHRLFRGYLDGYRVLTLSELTARDQHPIPLQAAVVASEADHERWKRLTAEVPEWQRLPVITCCLRTATVTAKKIRADSYLTKPVARAQLRAALRRLIPAERKNARILVAEDEPEMCRLLVRMLRSIEDSYQVETVPDGQAALILLRARSYDAVLLDLLMPTLDGYTVLDTIREDGRLCELPVIVITAHGRQRDALVASEVRVSRADDLTIADVMRWIRGGLDALLAPGTSAPVPRSTMPE